MNAPARPGIHDGHIRGWEAPRYLPSGPGPNLRPAPAPRGSAGSPAAPAEGSGGRSPGPLLDGLADAGGPGVVGHEGQVQVPAEAILQVAQVADAQADAEGGIRGHLLAGQPQALLLGEEVERAGLDLHQPPRPLLEMASSSKSDSTSMRARIEQRIIPRALRLLGDGLAELAAQREARDPGPAWPAPRRSGRRLGGRLGHGRHWHHGVGAGS